MAPGCRFGYDIIEYVGTAVWLKSRTVLEIQSDLANQNIFICERHIANLAKKYVWYVVEAIADKQPELRQFLHRGGGYFMYFDSMHPGNGAAHMMCAIAEEISERISIVLGCVKLAQESTETVSAFLRKLKEKYGNPLAGVCDMLASNLEAFKEVFPEALLLICHFHFLRGLGKSFLDYENTLLTGLLDRYDVTSRLREIAKKCREIIDNNPKLAKLLNHDKKLQSESLQKLPEVVKAYYMIMWIFAYKQELNGYGFPFDRANLAYIQRMQNIFNTLKDEPVECNELSELKYFLASYLMDPDFQKTVTAFEKKVKDFDHLREIMKIAPIGGGKGLNDDGVDCDMTIMEKELKAFIELDKITKNPNKSYKQLIKQILKYWPMLFAKPVKVVRPNGETIFIYPQRTSNCMERFFRGFQQNERKRTGMDTLGRTVMAMIAETPMMKNLKCPEFVKIILNGQPNLASRFAELDIKRAGEKAKAWEHEEALPPGVKRIIKDLHFYKVFMKKRGKVKKCA